MSLPLAAALLALSGVEGLAQDPPIRHTMTVIEENDFFAHISASDKHYSQGLRLEHHVFDAAAGPFFTLRSLYDADRLFSNGVAVGQAMYTPEDITADPPDPLERPFAAWLYLSFMTTVTDPGRHWQDSWEWSVGTVGPRALGDEIQSFWHRLIGADNPTWAGQLKNEIGGGFSWKRQWTSVAAGEEKTDWSARTITCTGFTASTVVSELVVGAKVLWGYRAPADFEAGQGSRSFQEGEGFRFYGFAGVEGRFIPWNSFLDGNVFRESASVTRKYLTADFVLGVVLRLGQPFGISYEQVFRSGEIESDPAYHNFGSIALSWSFEF